MSLMLPRETVDAMRVQVDVSLANFGIDCILYVPTNVSYATEEKKDVFSVPSDLTYISYDAKVFVQWSVSTYRLKQLGLFTEDALPIVAYFGSKAVAREGSEVGQEVSVDPIRRSYFTIEPEFIPNDYVGSESFELVNEGITGMHDKIITRVFSIVPRRIKI